MDCENIGVVTLFGTFVFISHLFLCLIDSTTFKLFDDASVELRIASPISNASPKG